MWFDWYNNIEAREELFDRSEYIFVFFLWNVNNNNIIEQRKEREK
jgi:hypothetical protein